MGAGLVFSLTFITLSVPFYPLHNLRCTKAACQRFFAYFFPLHASSCPVFAFSLCLLPPPFLYFLRSLQSAQANFGLCRKCSQSGVSRSCRCSCLIYQVKPELEAGGSFHLCNVVCRHANALAVHPQTAAAHLLTPFLAPQLTHFSYTPQPRCLFFPRWSSLRRAGVDNFDHAHLSWKALVLGHFLSPGRSGGGRPWQDNVSSLETPRATVEASQRKASRCYQLAPPAVKSLL